MIFRVPQNHATLISQGITALQCYMQRATSFLSYQQLDKYTNRSHKGPPGPTDDQQLLLFQKPAYFVQLMS